jgi:hypothetical protein
MASLSMKFLEGLGIETDKAELICERHKEVVTEIKDERDKYKVEAEKLPNVQRQLSELQEEAKNNSEDKYKVKYDALKEDFEEYKKGVTAKETKSKKESAYTKLLKAAGVSEKRISAILKVTNFDDIELDENGDAKDADKLTESIKSEWADFISTTSTQGANVANPPANNTSKSIKTKKEIMEIKDTAERQQAWKDYLTSNQKGN